MSDVSRQSGRTEETREISGNSETGSVRTIHWVAPILVALIGAFMAILDSSIVNVAIPQIMNVFNAGTGDAQWVATAYLLALGVVVPLSGWLGDRFGLKRTYIASMAMFVVGSLLCSMSFSINTLIAARIIQALGGGMIMPVTMAMVYRMVPRNKIGGAMGIFGLALLVAPAIGPTLGGYLVEYVNWRWIFTINLPVGIIGVLLSIAIIPQFPSERNGKLDVAGSLTSAAGLFCLLLAFSKGADWGWGSEAVVLLFYFSVTFLALFVYIELTSPHPLIDLRVFKYPTFAFANITIAVTTIGMYAGLFYLPLFLQTIRGLGAMETGLLLMPGALVSGAMMPIVGRLFDKIGPRALVLSGLVLLTVLTYTFHLLNLLTPWATITTWVMVRGLVIPLANMPAQTAAMADLPTELVSRASAMTNIVSRVSSAFGIAVLTSVLNHRIAIHSQRMGDALTPWAPAVTDFLHRYGSAIGRSGEAARRGALVYLHGLVARQSFVKGIDDVFVIAAALTVVGIIPSLFLKRGNRAGGPLGAAE